MLDLNDFTRRRVRARLIAVLSESGELHTRELVRRTSASPRAVQVALEQLGRAGIARSRRLGGLRLWSLATGNPLLGPLQDLAKRTVGIPAALARAFSNVAGVDLAFIYGSYALGTADLSSDIDVFLLGHPDWKALAGTLEQLRKEIVSEINVVAWTVDDLANRQTTPFYRTLKVSPKIWLKGKEGDFEGRARRVVATLRRSGPGRASGPRRRRKQAPAGGT
jgi:predicted nucleotidyltransferase